MDFSEKPVNQISDNLLSFLREELSDTKINYEIPISPLEGGYDTSVFKFKLKNVKSSFSKPMVLRLFRKSHPAKQAILESVIQNSLIDQGFLVPYVYYACMDDKYLGNQFLIMDFMTGELLPNIFEQNTAIVLGKTHAALHKADSSQLKKDLVVEGFVGLQYDIERRLDRLVIASERLPWLAKIVFWLIKNKPSDCDYSSICHGDFHPYNLLAKNGEITAILDWSSCVIGDPAVDVASTLVIFNAATKHLIPSLDTKIESQKYLDAYRGQKYLSEDKLRYYQVLFSTLRLLGGIEGILIWCQTPIQNELINIIYEISKIPVEVPR